jgi:hypothetical protein
MMAGTLRTILTLVCVAAAGGHAGAAADPLAATAMDSLTRNVASFSPSTGTPCAELVLAFRQADTRLIRYAVAVADAIEDRDERALSRACANGRQSAADARDALAALERRCPDHADAVRSELSELPGDYAPAALLLSRCN